MGFTAGFVIAVFFAVLSFRFSFVETVLAPVMTLLKAIPVVSFVVLLLIWWGASFLSVAICFLVVLPNLYVNTLAGLKNTPVSLLEMAKVFRLPFWNCFYYIYRPALKPFLLSGLSISLGMCWKSGVAAEVIGTPAFSIGERLYMSKIYLDTAGVFAWTAVTILLSWIFEKGCLLLMNKWFSFEPRVKTPESRSEGTDGLGTLRAEHVNKRYGDKNVLVDFCAEYVPGEIYYLTWPSGAGKTTLLRLLCGLEEADGGEMSCTGDASVMFQEDRLCEEYSAVRNVEMVLGNACHAREALLNLLDADDIEKPCSQLSGGMKRRVALVRAMEAKSDYLLLDEPFTGMDEKTRKRARKYIVANTKGRTVIIATHTF
ncbi:MAG: ATP-binding cassette domain-containing protein [Lachnospiraceae bacterium]|nr:ATP-binding cassette domain-containing protein [Lachnospiraceae bacterium]